jgi:ATP phosphoribosyltransferase
VIIFIIPKNSGLEKARELVKEFEYKEILEVRGEDIPLFVSDLSKQGKNVIGITGEDLYREFLLKNRDNNLSVLRVVNWQDSKCLFGKPTLCLLGPKNKQLENLPKKLRICINRKYQRFTNKYCINKLVSRGYEIEKIYVSGASEEMFQKKMVDLVVDIVYSGKSAEKVGLEVYDKLFCSDIVVIGGKNEIS